jgi:glycosyltransferase involved in cell wall biosynthesis
MIVDICNAFSKKYNFIVKLDFYGEGILVNEITTLTLFAPLLKVRLCGHEPINSDLLYKYDLHISASYAEGLPNSVIETLSQGIPNFISSIDEHLEFKNYANDLLAYFNHSDELEDIASKLMFFIFNLDDRKANSTRLNFLYDFSRDKTAINYIEIYKELTN